MPQRARAQLDIACACGAVRGEIRNLTAKLANRNTCCCADCQRFLVELGHEDQLDQYGGTEVLFLPVSHVAIFQGADQLACLHLSERGLHRWYTQCCKTAIGNSFKASWPFFSVITTCIAPDQRADLDDRAGASLGYVNLQNARTAVPKQLRANLPRVISRAVWRLISWRARGWHQPSSFFDAEGQPIAAPQQPGMA